MIVKTLNRPLFQLESPKVSDLDVRPLETVTHHTGTLSLQLSGNHSEAIQVLIMPTHCSLIDFHGSDSIFLLLIGKKLTMKVGSVFFFFCHANCLKSPNSPDPSLPNETKEDINLANVPA